MVEFVRGQTIKIYATIAEEEIPDLAEISSISFVIKQKGIIKMDKSTAECYIQDRRIYTSMTQEETLRFETGKADIQLSVLLRNSTRTISKNGKGQVEVYELLKEGTQE